MSLLASNCSQVADCHAFNLFRRHAIREHLAARRAGRVVPEGLIAPSWSNASLPASAEQSTIEE